eukprot:108455_1
MTTRYKVGDKIVLFKRHQEAIIRYIGQTDFAPDEINYGIQLLDDAIGDNNGTVNNIKYFTCPKNKGLFVWEKDIKFKIQSRKKSFKKEVNKNKKQSSKRKISEPKRKDSKPLPRQKSQKKLGPRDMGRNDNYKGITDPNINNNTNKMIKKRK